MHSQGGTRANVGVSFVLHEARNVRGIQNGSAAFILVQDAAKRIGVRGLAVRNGACLYL